MFALQAEQRALRNRQARHAALSATLYMIRSIIQATRYLKVEWYSPGQLLNLLLPFRITTERNKAKLALIEVRIKVLPLVYVNNIVVL